MAEEISDEDLPSGEHENDIPTSPALRAAVAVLAVLYIGLFGLILHGFTTGWLPSLWISIKPAQAEILKGVLTLLASATAAVLLPYLLSGQLRDVKEVAAEAKRYLETDLKSTTDEANRILGVIEQQAYRAEGILCLLYTSPSPRDRTRSRMPSSA